MHAAQLAGLTTIPAIVRELSDDDAIVAMVDANIQREELLPSEKAFAYKMKLEAIPPTGSPRISISAVPSDIRNSAVNTFRWNQQTSETLRGCFTVGGNEKISKN